MTLDEIAYNILNLYRGGRSSHNEHISLRQIKFNIKFYRAMLIRRDYARNLLVSRHHEQQISCMELITVDASQCCSLPADCKVSRTKLKLPRTIRLNNYEGITHVGDVTGIHTIPQVDVVTVQFLPHDRFTKNTRKAYMIEDYLYVYNPDGIDAINIRGFFEDPEELAAYDCGGAGCYDRDSAFPLSMDLVEAITTGLVKGTFSLLAGTQTDLENDTVPGNSQRMPQPQAQDNGEGDQ